MTVPIPTAPTARLPSSEPAESQWELGASGSSRKSSYKQKQKTSATPVIVALAVALGVAGIGVGIYFATRSGDKPKEVVAGPEGKANAELKEAPGKLDKPKLEKKAEKNSNVEW